MRNPRVHFLQRVLLTLLWTIGTLIVMDAVIGFAFRMPAEPGRATSLQRYFDYGRSIEGKLRRYVGSSPDQDAMIVRAGWLSDCDFPTLARPGKRVFDIYGMSFSNNIADHLEQLDPNLAGQRFAGPEAPPNHSYACFVRRAQSRVALAPIQILGVLASSIPRMETLSGLTTSFEQPQPFTYPRYFVGPGGRLLDHSSSIKSQEDLRAALSNQGKWRAFLAELSSNDAFFVRRVVQADIFDHSVITRMIRRAFGQRTLRMRIAALKPEAAFSGAPDIAPVLGTMLVDFAARSRAAGLRPIVILFEDRGFGTALSAIAAPVLRTNRIDFVATSSIASPNDSANFIADGHFTPVVEERIARAVLALLDGAG